MASAVASKGAALPSFPKKLLAEPSASGAPVAFYAPRPAAVSPARGPNSTQGKEPRWYDDDSSDSEDEDADAGYRRPARARDFVVPSFPSQDVLDPVGIPACVDRLYALMEDGAAPPGLSSAAGAPRRGWWVEKDDDDAVYLTVPMLGLGK
ncbi:hypothetical protein CFC21_101800 [Triticum aestivum]|uniref:Uncharacterized protein n=3 Tax=Triticum TaxID=4564 RepID=A0A9R1BX32_TRITD|nr:26.2 kDa heat shock protein, mitochondrial-like [Triticum aestivum]KAF7100266.1 hypothetical protein CFC21_101800 [Triticum aestivum]VAI84280.1 unnamed protein product [Triticum turgidum subsp. durum]